MDHAQHQTLRRCFRQLGRAGFQSAACAWLAAGVLVLLAQPILVRAQDVQNSQPELSPDFPRIRAVPQVTPARRNRVARQSSVRVPLESAGPAALAASDYAVLAGKAHVAKAQDGSVVLEQAKSSTSVVSVVGPKATLPQRVGSTEQKLKLPWLVVDSQALNQLSVVRSARPFLKLARAVQWDPERNLHIAELLIGLDAESGDGGDLAEPLVASLVVSCDSVEPQSIRFTTIGSAGDQLVRVACSPKVKNERPEQVLSLRLQGAEYDYTFEVPRRPGRFELQASTSSVLGMGLGELSLTALQREEDGTPLITREPLVVPLHVNDGELTPDSLTIPAGAAQGSVAVHLRGNAQLQVRAGLAEHESAPVPIRVQWPFLLASMAPAGGALGGFMAVRWQRKQSARKTIRKRQHVMALVEGAIVGTVLVLTLMLVPTMGLVPNWARTAEVAWFVAAVFAGFLGLELLDRVARLFFRQRPESQAAPSAPAPTTRPSQE